MKVIHHRSPERQAAEQAGTYVYGGRPSKWGNQFKIGRDGTRDEVIRKFADWWFAPEQHTLRCDALVELRDAVVGCFCAPRPCHLHVIAGYVNDSLKEAL